MNLRSDERIGRLILISFAGPLRRTVPAILLRTVLSKQYWAGCPCPGEPTSPSIDSRGRDRLSERSVRMAGE